MFACFLGFNPLWCFFVQSIWVLLTFLNCQCLFKCCHFWRLLKWALSLISQETVFTVLSWDSAIWWIQKHAFIIVVPLTCSHCFSPGVFVFFQSISDLLFFLVFLHPEGSGSCSSCWRGVAGGQDSVQRSCVIMGNSWEKAWAERCLTIQAETAVQRALRLVLIYSADCTSSSKEG